jgi:hypothetical protein
MVCIYGMYIWYVYMVYMCIFLFIVKNDRINMVYYCNMKQKYSE